jgi:putative oxidoreductase
MSCFFAFSGFVLMGMELSLMLKILVTLYSAVLFIQSGFDKVFDWSGNRSYINGMFEKTVLRPIVPLLMPIITTLEVGAGLFSLVGAVLLVGGGANTVAVIGLLLGAKTILLLFFGMRIAKDYGGAAAITPYFIFFIGALVLFAV